MDHKMSQKQIRAMLRQMSQMIGCDVLQKAAPKSKMSEQQAKAELRSCVDKLSRAVRELERGSLGAADSSGVKVKIAAK